MTGKTKPSEAERKKSEEELLMQHHHTHCLENPEAFQKLKIENFKKWAEQDTSQRARQLEEAQAGE